ncbi:MAG TPA: hypothetical protein PK385_04760 [Spirochaetota bacterium]|nr:hypothetical protein [Spirochaetota bacterium]HOS33978.1 hypothetical protein [Spirochaetota bacterium]HOS55350.1 hypothetical protein [Spirochaetota bacterium]HPK62093.1 hypothetical protein [Spirochaetota bacterium]HQF77861.1 hypothetical protein [Spirochaetota bacterium]
MAKKKSFENTFNLKREFLVPIVIILAGISIELLIAGLASLIK